MKPILATLLLLLSTRLMAQPYAPIKTNWKDAGYKGTKPTFSQTKNILNFGGDASGTTSNNTALTNAINALNGAPGVVFFPAGNYLFQAAININRDSIIFRGAGHDSTMLRFDLGGSVTNLIQVSGTNTNDTGSITTAAIRSSMTTTINNAGAFQANDWVALRMDDQSLTTSAWAFGSVSQLMQLQSVNGNVVTFKSPFRFNYQMVYHPFICKQIPRNNVGFECLKVKRMDATIGQASNIVFDNAVNCWVNGVEGDITNFAHVEINHSSNIEVTNSYFHDAFAYGDNGQAYGVLLQLGSDECKIEANYFNHLRHSMLLQAGANGNVLGYNYSTNPFWTEPSLPDSSAGDIVLHGNYPFMNLAEGNFVRNIVIDDSHGKNGPLNTIFRNRASGYGIFMNFNPATDSMQFIGNEITNNTIGLNFIQGVGHFQYGNNLKGALVNGTANIPDTSLYLGTGQKPPCPNGYGEWPVVGRPNGYNTGTIYAKARVLIGKPAACACVSVPASTAVNTVVTKNEWSIYPNPASERFVIEGQVKVAHVAVYNMAGVLVMEVDKPSGSLDIGRLASGIYAVKIVGGGDVMVRRLVKE